MTAKRTVGGALLTILLTLLTYAAWELNVDINSDTSFKVGGKARLDSNKVVAAGTKPAGDSAQQPTGPKTPGRVPHGAGKSGNRITATSVLPAAEPAISEQLPGDPADPAVTPTPGSTEGTRKQEPGDASPDRPSNGIKIFVPFEDASAEARDSQIRLADGLSRIGVLALTIEAADAILRCECDADSPSVLWTLTARASGITVWQKLVMTGGGFVAKDVAHSVFLDLKGQMAQIETELTESAHGLLN